MFTIDTVTLWLGVGQVTITVAMGCAQNSSMASVTSIVETGLYRGKFVL